ncbi:MAG: hypothetical protein ABSB11_11285 [Sedimentisphaerales bacterium]|jgi:hypothetical protein
MDKNINNSELSPFFQKTSWLLWLDILLTILTLLLNFGFYRYCAVSDYNFGVNPDPDSPVMWKILISTLLYFIFIFILFLDQIAATIILFAQKLTRQGIISFILLFVCIFVVCIAYKNRKPGIYYIFQGHTDRIKRDVDFKLIRDWSNTVDTSKQDDYGIPKERWPSFIKQLKANTVFVEKKENIGTVVKFEWGGTFVHWGLVVGPPDMDVSESQNRSDLKRGDEYRLKLAPGAYVWHDIR